ncbi:MAG TPA: M1 family aminopeptidase [Bryobacteraceae bacterium]|nr:M1 family aminopeptidase [Bryobacteraceae bacterium]
MFTNFFLFEINYRLHRVSTYVYFAIFFLMAFFSVSAEDFGPAGTGKVLLNSPYALTVIYLQMTSFGTLIISALFGTAILRDFQENTFQLLFTRPITKTAYLGGRWAGSLIVTVLVFSGLIFGALLGSVMPWADKTRMAPIHLWFYLQPFLSVVTIQIFFLGSIFFFVAALSRRLVVVYMQGVIVFALYLIPAIYVLKSQTLNTFWPSVLDPIGLIWFDTTTKYWTVAEKNVQLLSWSGALLYNRIVWMGVGLLSLIGTFAFFPMSAETLGSRYGGRRASRKRETAVVDEEQAVQTRHALRLPSVSRTFGGRASLAQMAALTRVRMLNIVREIPFWAIAFVMIVLAVLNGREAGRFEDTAVWPVTYLMVSVVAGSSALFLYVIATLYAGELIWRERNVNFDQIHDSLPLPGWVNWASQFLSLAIVELVLYTIVMLCGIGVQAASGYYHFELLVYWKELYLVSFTGVLAYILVALFVQTMVPNKFAAHAIVIGMVLVVPILYRYGIENRLYLFGEIAPYNYSDMNGYGHFVPALFWSLLYWLAFGGILGVLSLAFARRGTDLDWRSRWRSARRSLPGLSIPLAVCLVAFLASGAWYYYNGHVVNRFRTSKEDRRITAEYERLYKKYERLPQPKITAVEANVDIFSERRSLSGEGHFNLVNSTSAPIEEVHVTDFKESVEELRFDRSFSKILDDRRHHYAIYKLSPPLAPGDSARMDFRISYQSHGFRDGNERAELAFNGTFFDRDYFPGIGYNQGAELDNPVRRREEKLPPLEEMAPPGDPYYTNVNLFTPDANWITYKTVVSTSGDQTAIAPGYLKREWTANGRRYFEYDMGPTKIADFYSYSSGRYLVKRDQWHNVKLEIYYHPGHEYNLDRMLDAAKKGLDYYERNFGAYQFDQFRVLEFPRYRTFAQSFPNTVPYSEQLGFIQRVEKPEDLDEIFYITAHELAHQWWGHQLIGSATQGSNMMSETLAQYSALMIMEKEYGPSNIRKFLKHELDGYLRGRSGEQRKEPPLALVQREPYVWYNKGSLVMYALRDYIGEDRLNAALRGFLEKSRYATGPYPDTRGFVAALREATPPEMQYLISDLFESITLFDNKAVTAVWSPASGNKYKVDLTVSARKLKADGSGNETEVPIDDLIDIGVFSGAKQHEKQLYLEKRRINAKEQKFTVIVDEKPTLAGIDPYNKLIDRKPDDNWAEVARAQ